MIETKQLEHGFTYLDINNNHAHLKIALHGGHIFYYKPHNQEELLWTSQTSFYKEGKAIRGGIPICWPWFGKHPSDTTLPQHGFARISLWECVAVDKRDPNETTVTLELKHSKESLNIWPYRFKLTLMIIVNQTLTVSLTTHNNDTQAFIITEALHSYFHLDDITHVTVKGLENISYIDQLDHNTIKSSSQPLTIHKEVDRAYINTNNTLTLTYRNKTVTMISRGSSSTVVWNPWIEKSRQISDFHTDGYKEMLCIETANVYDNLISIDPQKSHTMEVQIITTL